jgi:hypothetical protein
MNLDEELKNKVEASLILEIIGRPPEHIKEFLEELINKINLEEGISVKNKKIKEPVEIKDKPDFYSSFAEVDLELKNIILVSLLIFKYMPSHVEITNPEKISMKNNDWNDIFNEITRRLHSYEELARVLQMQNAQMQKKLKELEEDKK